jgi:hypothetical protein
MNNRRRHPPESRHLLRLHKVFLICPQVIKRAIAFRHELLGLFVEHGVGDGLRGMISEKFKGLQLIRVNRLMRNCVIREQASCKLPRQIKGTIATGSPLRPDHGIWRQLSQEKTSADSATMARRSRSARPRAHEQRSREIFMERVNCVSACSLLARLSL